MPAYEIPSWALGFRFLAGWRPERRPWWPFTPRRGRRQDVGETRGPKQAAGDSESPGQAEHSPCGPVGRV